MQLYAYPSELTARLSEFLCHNGSRSCFGKFLASALLPNGLIK